MWNANHGIYMYSVDKTELNIGLYIISVCFGMKYGSAIVVKCCVRLCLRLSDYFTLCPIMVLKYLQSVRGRPI